MHKLTFSGIALSVNSSSRSWSKKDKTGAEIPGTLASHTILEVVLQLKDGSIIQFSSVDPTFPIPEQGKQWETPRILTYNAYGIIPQIRA